MSDNQKHKEEVMVYKLIVDDKLEAIESSDTPSQTVSTTKDELLRVVSTLEGEEMVVSINTMSLWDKLKAFLERNLCRTDEFRFFEDGFTYNDSINVVEIGRYSVTSHIGLGIMALDLDVDISPSDLPARHAPWQALSWTHNTTGAAKLPYIAGKQYEVLLYIRRLEYQDQVYYHEGGALRNGNDKLEESIYKPLLDAVTPYIIKRAMDISQPYSLIPDLEGYDIIPDGLNKNLHRQLWNSGIYLSTQLRDEALSYGLYFNIAIEGTTVYGEAILMEGYCLARIDRDIDMGDPNRAVVYRDAITCMAGDIKAKAQERLADLLAFITIAYK